MDGTQPIVWHPGLRKKPGDIFARPVIGGRSSVRKTPLPPLGDGPQRPSRKQKRAMRAHLHAPIVTCLAPKGEPQNSGSCPAAGIWMDAATRPLPPYHG